MFDQLTDYNDVDNDEELAHSRRRRQEVGRGEDDEYSDNGEDEAGNLFYYRQRIQAINDELGNFIAMMTDGGQGEDDDENESQYEPETSIL